MPLPQIPKVGKEKWHKIKDIVKEKWHKIRWVYRRIEKLNQNPPSIFWTFQGWRRHCNFSRIRVPDTSLLNSNSFATDHTVPVQWKRVLNLRLVRSH